MIRTAPVVVEQHVLGREQAVRDPVRVRHRDRVGHLADQPGPAPRRERAVAGQHDVEGGPGPPLVDDEAAGRRVRSTSRTRRIRWSRTVAERRAASSSRSARGSSAAITCRATCRSRIRSCARQNRPPPLSLSRSTSRYRSASTSPARVACGTLLSPTSISLWRGPRGAIVGPGQARARRVSVASTSLTSRDPQQAREDQEEQHVDGPHARPAGPRDHDGPGVVGQAVEDLGDREGQRGGQPGGDQPAGRRRRAAAGCAARRGGGCSSR